MSGWFGARRPVESAVWTLVDALKGKFSPRQGATSGRFPLTSKRAPRNFYKGKGAISLGFISKKGALFFKFSNRFGTG